MDEVGTVIYFSYMNLIKFIRIFLLILIVVGLGLLVTQKMWVPKVVEMILKGENKEQPIPVVLNNKDETINWKTYSSDKYGIEFKYPPNLTVEFNGPVLGDGEVDQFNVTDPNFDHTDKIGQAHNEIDQVTFDIFPYAKDSFEQEIKKYQSSYAPREGAPAGCMELPKETSIKSQSGEIKVYEIPCSLVGPYLQGHFHNDTYMFRVTAVWHEELAYNILSTFKFTK